MRLGVLGTGDVGRTIAARLIELGHEVRMGSRTAGNERAVAWVLQAGGRASQGTFRDAAGYGEIVVNCTAGGGALEALAAAGAQSLAGKVLIDVSNPLDFTQGGPRLFVCNDDSLGERIQAAVPGARVVKALNTMTAAVMVDPGGIPGDHVAFLCGDDDAAKTRTTALLEEFGWPMARIVDLGDITAARGMEMYLPLWLSMMRALGTTRFNVAVAR